jgi:hypothetical protein
MACPRNSVPPDAYYASTDPPGYLDDFLAHVSAAIRLGAQIHPTEMTPAQQADLSAMLHTLTVYRDLLINV